MQPSRLLFQLVVVPILVVVIPTVTVSGQDKLCFNVGNFTANDTLQTSLDSLLGSIATANSSTMAYGLFNASTSPSQSSEVIETMGYCRGDLDSDSCRACLNTSAYSIRQLCPVQKKAVIFDEKCTLKYSNDLMYGVVDLSRGRYRLNGQNASNWDTFSTALKKLLDDLRDQASSGGPFRKYAAGTGAVDLLTLYATVQCSPDLDNQQCSDCLNRIAGLVPTGKVGARTLWPSCQLRYEIYRFYDPTISLSSPTPPPTMAAAPPSSSLPGKKKSSNAWIIVAASSASVIILVVFLAFLIAKRRKGRALIRLQDDAADEITMAESLQFDLEVIIEATENFSDAKKLGRGGFGSVYLGTLPNGKAIAVKRLSQNSGQGEQEFKNEVVLLARLQHRNLVRLLGFCLEGSERLLVYEFVPNSSLDHFIFDPIKRACLDWDTRYKIIMGIARGLLYLHEDSRLRIIHRDLKASNILLDADMSPKVSDFGMARLFEIDQTQADTNRIVGTFGYMAPEYVLHGHFSLKSDVFSFGVLVLEIVSGRKNNDMRSRTGGDPEILISHVWRSWQEGKISDIVDPLVAPGYSTNILRCIHIGLLCVQENMSSRPTMASVIVMLNSDSVSLPMPTQPAFLTSATYVGDISSSVDRTSSADGTSASSQVDHSGNRTSEGLSTRSLNGLTITELYPR